MKGLSLVLTISIFLAGTILVTEVFERKTSSKFSQEKILKLPNVFCGVSFKKLPLNEIVEKTLQSDATVNGFYEIDSNKKLKVFSSADFSPVNRYSDPEIFWHTPDVCWIGAGWNRLGLKDSEEQISVDSPHGRHHLERRVYEQFGNQELCYFAFIRGGKTIDFIKSSANRAQKKYNLKNAIPHFWNHLVGLLRDLFIEDQEPEGVQFIRISIDLEGDTEHCDEILTEFITAILPQLIVP